MNDSCFEKQIILSQWIICHVVTPPAIRLVVPRYVTLIAQKPRIRVRMTLTICWSRFNPALAETQRGSSCTHAHSCADLSTELCQKLICKLYKSITVQLNCIYSFYYCKLTMINFTKKWKVWLRWLVMLRSILLDIPLYHISNVKSMKAWKYIMNGAFYIKHFKNVHNLSKSMLTLMCSQIYISATLLKFGLVGTILLLQNAYWMLL